jgi:hypothetical protein
MLIIVHSFLYDPLISSAAHSTPPPPCSATRPIVIPLPNISLGTLYFHYKDVFPLPSFIIVDSLFRLRGHWYFYFYKLFFPFSFSWNFYGTSFLPLSPHGTTSTFANQPFYLWGYTQIFCKCLIYTMIHSLVISYNPQEPLYFKTLSVSQRI